MTTRHFVDDPVRYARIAGLLYVLIALISAFSIGYVPSIIIISGDAAATSANLLANQGLFALGVVGDTAIIPIEVALTVMLFVMLRPVNRTLALISTILRLSEVMVMAINLVVYIMPLVVLTNSGSAFTPEQQQATAMLLFEAHQYGIYVWSALFGFSLFLLGYLVSKSGYFPWIIGGAMAVGSFGYVIEGLSAITFVEHTVIWGLYVALLTLATVAEVGFGLWLLIKGLDLQVFRAKVGTATF